MLRWKDPEDYQGCRAEGCRARRLWVVEGNDYEDRVCLFHVASFLLEFVELTSAPGTEVTLYRPKATKPAHIVPSRPSLNGPSGDLTHLLGYIDPEKVQ